MKCLRRLEESWIVFPTPSVLSQIRLSQASQAELGFLNVLIKNQYQNEVFGNFYEPKCHFLIDFKEFDVFILLR